MLMGNNMFLEQLKSREFDVHGQLLWLQICNSR